MLPPSGDTPRTRLTVLAPILLSASLLAALVGGCAERRDRPGTYESFARAFCAATARYAAGLAPAHPGAATAAAGPVSRDASWARFVGEFERAAPPAELQGWHDYWLGLMREDLESFRRGEAEAPEDPFARAPEMPAGAKERFAEAAAGLRECQLQPQLVAGLCPAEMPSPRLFACLRLPR